MPQASIPAPGNANVNVIAYTYMSEACFHHTIYIISGIFLWIKKDQAKTLLLSVQGILKFPQTKFCLAPPPPTFHPIPNV